MKKFSSILLISAFAISLVGFNGYAMPSDDDNLDPSLKMPVRKLYPDRVAAEQQKKADKKKKKVKPCKSGEQCEYYVMYHELLEEQAAQQQHAQESVDMAALDSLLNIDYTIVDYAELYKPKPLKWQDEPLTSTADELKPYFKSLRSELGQECLIPKDVTMGHSDNQVYFYFDDNGSAPTALRLRAQYYADDPLMMDHVKFIVNGFDYIFHPTAIQTGKNGSRMYWETFDNALNSQDKDLIYALSHASWASVTFISSTGINHNIDLTKEQIQDFYRTLQLYQHLGGKL